MDKPNNFIDVLAKIEHVNCLGRVSWYEVVFHNGEEWKSYCGSGTFSDGERVIDWRYVDECFK